MRTRTTLTLTLAAVMALGLSLASSSAEAQDRGSRRGKVIRLGTFKVEGTIQKPQAFYILQRSNLNFEGLELKNSFLPKIIKSVEKAPF